MAAFSTFLGFLKWKMDGKWEMENGNRIHHPCVLLGSRGEFAKWPFRGLGLSNASHKPTDFWPVWLSVVQLPDCSSSRSRPLATSGPLGSAPTDGSISFLNQHLFVLPTRLAQAPTELLYLRAKTFQRANTISKDVGTMVGCGGNGKSVSPYVAFDPHGVGHLFASTVRRVSPSYIQCPRKERQHDLFKPGRYLVCVIPLVQFECV